MNTSPKSGTAAAQPTLRAKRLGLHTQHQAVVVMRTDCHVCRSEGLASRSQVLVSTGDREVQATLFQIEESDLLAIDQVALSETAWQILNAEEGEEVTVTHAPTLESLSSVRRRIYGNRLAAPAFVSIVKDVAARRYGFPAARPGRRGSAAPSGPDRGARCCPMRKDAEP